MRRKAYDARAAQPNKDELSARICQQFMHLPAYQSARTVMWYVHCRSEVRTLRHLIEALEQDKRIVVPYCTVNERGDNQLGLWHLENLDELKPGKWNILEPPKQRWQDLKKSVLAMHLDLIMVPGVAFDRHGARLGNGAGYYDRLLIEVREDCQLIGVCFESQLHDEVIMDRFDIHMDQVLTEEEIYLGQGR